MRRKIETNAFTLIELLVVIAIISLLVSILLPSLKQAKDLAKAVVCMTNQKQMGLANMMYVDDWDGLIVPTRGGAWNIIHSHLLMPYCGDSKEVFLCPTGVAMGETWNVYTGQGLPAPAGGDILSTDGKEALSRKLGVDLLACSQGKLSISDDISSWGKPMVSLNDRTKLLPADPSVPWSGPEDFSAKAWWRYDERHFYFAVLITDDIQNTWDDRAGAFWRGDCIQFAFDPANDGRPFVANFDSNDIELGAVLAKDGSCGKVFMTYPSTKELNIPCKVRRSGTQTLYVISVPWKLLKITPKQGKVFSFNFIAVDADEKHRYCWLGPRPGIAQGKMAHKYLDLYLE